MRKFFSFNIILYLKGPILSKGTTNTMGLDSIFYRKSDGLIALKGSHVKGKLRDSFHDLEKLVNLNNFTIDGWFGKKMQEAFDTGKGKLFFSDFDLMETNIQKLKPSTRNSIDRKTGTARDKFLQINENLFVSGSTSAWKGCIQFWAENDKEASSIAESLKVGLKWIGGFGSMKGCGFGRLTKIDVQLNPNKQKTEIAITNTTREYHLTIRMIDDLFVGGKVNSSNYRESVKIISGSVLKGSVARAINDLCGAELNEDINNENKNVYSQFPNLATNFSKIRFTNAFPSGDETKRPVFIPMSTVYSDNKEYKDVAHVNKFALDHTTKKAPTFRIDWKGSEYIEKEFGWEDCITINKTRTSIDIKSRTASENQLYTFQYISPYCNYSGTKANKKRIIWISNIIFPKNNTRETASELFDAIQQAWKYLGKRDSRFDFKINQGLATSAIKERSETIIDDHAVVVLQSDALLFHAFKQSNLENLRELYNKYWSEATNGNMYLVNFFARQKMVGGYFGHQYKQLHNNRYYPWVLTEAGSVFVLKAYDNDLANTQLSRLKIDGLPLPIDIASEVENLGISDGDSWKVCPFVAENGYGEISINLNWHWTKRFNAEQEK